jgi:hypothetical protein
VPALLTLLAVGQEPGVPPGEAQASEPIPVATPRRIDTLFEGALVGARDGQDFAETPSYRRLLELVARFEDQELRDQARRELDMADAIAHPDAWRGEIVRVRGLVAGLQAVRLSYPIGERQDCYRAIVTEADGSEGVVVDFLEAPPEVELRRDVVEVEGVFYRTVRYENLRDTVVEAPYLIARRPRLLDQDALPRRTILDHLSKILIGAAVLFFVVRVLLSMRRARARAPRSEQASRALRERAQSNTPRR